jgi:hypothetical protein
MSQMRTYHQSGGPLPGHALSLVCLVLGFIFQSLLAHVSALELVPLYRKNSQIRKRTSKSQTDKQTKATDTHSHVHIHILSHKRTTLLCAGLVFSRQKHTLHAHTDPPFHAHFLIILTKLCVKNTKKKAKNTPKVCSDRKMRQKHTKKKRITHTHTTHPAVIGPQPPGLSILSSVGGLLAIEGCLLHGILDLVAQRIKLLLVLCELLVCEFALPLDGLLCLAVFLTEILDLDRVLALELRIRVCQSLVR